MIHDGAIQPRDELQARVVERLRANHGAPVSFSELRAMGIENPALLGYELAAAGLPIEQVREWGSRALILDPVADGGRPAAAERSDERADDPPAPMRAKRASSITAFAGRGRVRARRCGAPAAPVPSRALRWSWCSQRCSR